MAVLIFWSITYFISIFFCGIISICSESGRILNNSYTLCSKLPNFFPESYVIYIPISMCSTLSLWLYLMSHWIFDFHFPKFLIFLCEEYFTHFYWSCLLLSLLLLLLLSSKHSLCILNTIPQSDIHVLQIFTSNYCLFFYIIIPLFNSVFWRIEILNFDEI